MSRNKKADAGPEVPSNGISTESAAEASVMEAAKAKSIAAWARLEAPARLSAVGPPVAPLGRPIR